MLGNISDANDAVQETFLKYMLSNKKFSNDEHEKAWLAYSHFLRTAGPHFPDSPGHIKRTAWDISRAEGTPPH